MLSPWEFTHTMKSRNQQGVWKVWVAFANLVGGSCKSKTSASDLMVDDERGCSSKHKHSLTRPARSTTFNLSCVYVTGRTCRQLRSVFV